MKVSALIAVFSAAVAVLAFELPPGVPRSVEEFRAKHPLQKRNRDCSRKTIKIRASKDDADDVADEFLAGLKKANHGGTLYLPKGKTYMIGKPLDLTFLNNIHVHLDGEIKVLASVPAYQLSSIVYLTVNSSQTTRRTGKRIPSATRSRTPSCSGSGEARTSRSTGRACSTATAKGGGMSSPVLRYWTQRMPTFARSCSTPRTQPI
jgi:hypothetical protein